MLAGARDLESVCRVDPPEPYPYGKDKESRCWSDRARRSLSKEVGAEISTRSLQDNFGRAAEVDEFGMPITWPWEMFQRYVFVEEAERGGTDASSELWPTVSGSIEGADGGDGERG